MLIAASAVGAADVPDVFVEKNVGGYCASSNRLTARQDVALFSAPPHSGKDRTSSGTIKKGEVVAPKGYEFHSVPSRLLVQHKKDDFKPGDDVWVLSYHGEGEYVVKHGAIIKTIDTAIDNYPSPGADPCKYISDCWAILEKPIKSTCWIYVEDDKHRGWAEETYLDSGKW